MEEVELLSDRFFNPRSRRNGTESNEGLITSLTSNTLVPALAAGRNMHPSWLSAFISGANITVALRLNGSSMW
jgi:hypothetical protein